MPPDRRTALIGFLCALATSPAWGKNRERDRPRRNYFEEQEERREREATRQRDRDRTIREEDRERRETHRRWFPRERMAGSDEDE